MNLTRIIECHGEVWVVKFGFGGQGGGESRDTFARKAKGQYIWMERQGTRDRCKERGQ